MTTFNLSLDYDCPVALLEPDGDGRPRRILLVIDWASKIISVETRAHNDDTQSECRWRGMEDAYPLPPLVDATRLREWVEEEVLPRALPLLEAYRTVWDDVDQFGRFPGHEMDKEEFDRWMLCDAEPPLHEGGLWSVADWLAGGVEEVSHETTDAAIEALADTIVDEAAAENVVLVGGREAVRAYLLDYRQDLQDAIPEPDRYEIEGYEVLEKTARASGTTARVLVPRRWVEKRVKIVRIDP
jgi:putative transposon-encoded protein